MAFLRNRDQVAFRWTPIGIVMRRVPTMPVILRWASDGRLDRELTGVSSRQALAIGRRIVGGQGRCPVAASGCVDLRDLSRSDRQPGRRTRR